jgi:hypothetical protein
MINTGVSCDVSLLSWLLKPETINAQHALSVLQEFAQNRTKLHLKLTAFDEGVSLKEWQLDSGPGIGPSFINWHEQCGFHLQGEREFSLRNVAF